MLTTTRAAGSDEEEEVGAAGSDKQWGLARGLCGCGQQLGKAAIELHDGEEEWVTRLRAGRQQQQGKRMRQWGSGEEAREEVEGSGSPARPAIAGEGGGCGVSVRSAQRWLQLRAREAAALADDRSRGKEGGCARVKQWPRRVWLRLWLRMGGQRRYAAAAVGEEEKRRQWLGAAGGRWALKWIEDNGHNRGWQVAVMPLAGAGCSHRSQMESRKKK
ncbi:hypothetical protein BHM03_00024603 [Ensete ventricosum]|nr:hypothetical protein BHM03_00024603 [Ensete ventricosum]